MKKRFFAILLSACLLLTLLPAAFSAENYEFEIYDGFDGAALDPAWGDRQGSLTPDAGAGTVTVTDPGGSGIAAFSRPIGNRGFSVEFRWEDYSSAGNGVALFRVYRDNDSTIAEIGRHQDNKIRFTTVGGGKTINNDVPYTATYGWFRIDFDSETSMVTGYYRVEDGDEYTPFAEARALPQLQGVHIVQLIVDSFQNNRATSVAADEMILHYNNFDNGSGKTFAMKSSAFDVELDGTTGSIYKLAQTGDKYGTNYVLNPDRIPGYQIDDAAWLGNVFLTVNDGTGSKFMHSALADDVRVTSQQTENGPVTVSYTDDSTKNAGITGIDLIEEFALNDAGDRLDWNITLENRGAVDLSLEDLGFTFLMNSFWNDTQTGIYEQNVGRHSYVAEDGSYAYWQRPNGDGSILVMVPQAGTSLEFRDKMDYGETFGEDDPRFEGLVSFYVHSKNITKTRHGAYLPATAGTLEAGTPVHYGFSFYFADGIEDLQNVLYKAGLPEIISLPGMVIPNDMKATLAVRAKDGIESVTGEAGREISVTSKGVNEQGYTVYELTFGKPGAGKVTVTYGGGKTSVLQYYSTEPLEKLIDISTSFIVNNQQMKNSGRGYDGAFLQWDMANSRLVTWENYNGNDWKGWMAGGSDELGLSPALYISEKNLTVPDAEQIAALEYYLENFIWGYLQRHDTYEIYRWYDGTEGAPSDQGTWRSYNYAHVANTYYNMYKLAARYPELCHYLTAEEYLLRAYNTWNAMLTYGMFDGSRYSDGGVGGYKFGMMGEQMLPVLYQTLLDTGHTDEAAALKVKLDKKANEYIFGVAYPFASEMSIDTTGFEGCYAYAKMYGNTELVEKVTKASVACRGIQPLWYYYGVDNRSMGESWWNLSYETQLGAWQQQDWLLNYASADSACFDTVLRQTYGAYLAGWANINSGQITGGEQNYGAASWLYQSELGSCNHSWIPMLGGWWSVSGEAPLGFWGGLRTACVDVVEDSAVGLYGYGCDLTETETSYTVIPKDGVRTAMTFYNLNKLHTELTKARYTEAVVAKDLSYLSMTLEPAAAGDGTATLSLRNLPEGAVYDVLLDGEKTGTLTGAAAEQQLTVTLNREGANKLELVQPCGHDYQKDTAASAAPTCLEPGKDVYVCAKCGDSYEETVKALGHDFLAGIIREPTEDMEGETGYTCSRCGAFYSEPIDKLPCPSADYTDVNRKLWYHSAVDYVIENGFMGSTRTDALTFEPNTKVSRAMVASIMYRIAGSPEGVEYTGAFTDVREGKWFTTAIEWAAQNGLAAGKGDGKFDPNGNVTRQELAVFMYKLADYLGRDVTASADLSGFPDANTVPAWAKSYVRWAVAAGLISGKSSGGVTKLAPTDNATRAEFASIIMRFMTV